MTSEMMMCVPSISKQSPFSSSCSSAPKRKKSVLANTKWQEKRARQRQRAGEACSPTPTRRRSVLASAKAQEHRARQRQRAGATCSSSPNGKSIVLASSKVQRATTHVQSQTHFFEFELSLAEIQFSAKANAAAHVQSHTQFFWIWLEFE